MNSVSGALRAAPASTALAAVGLLALVACGWRLIAAEGEHDAAWGALTVAVTIGGCATLGWLRSASVGITAPQIMLVLGAAGMVAGLACDARGGGFDRLASLCLAASGDFVGTLRLHWRQLPLMHLGMIAGGLTTVPLLRALRPGCRRQFCARLVQNLACSAWMVVGMTAGTLVFLRLASWAGGRDAAAMLGGMFGGMVWGMVSSVSVYRLWYSVIDSGAQARRGD